ncbi:hypothetical protein NKH77_17100 [Streptomyces sp. M19]
MTLFGRLIEGKSPTDLIFTAPEGSAWHSGVFHAHRWKLALAAANAAGLAKRLALPVIQPASATNRSPPRSTDTDTCWRPRTTRSWRRSSGRWQARRLRASLKLREVWGEAACDLAEGYVDPSAPVGLVRTPSSMSRTTVGWWLYG